MAWLLVLEPVGKQTLEEHQETVLCQTLLPSAPASSSWKMFWDCRRIFHVSWKAFQLFVAATVASISSFRQDRRSLEAA